MPPQAEETDIVERLRAKQRASKGWRSHHTWMLCQDAIVEIERLRRSTPEQSRWLPMPKEKPGVFPFTGERLLVGWKAERDLSAHVELGRWMSGTGPRSGWCNTYGHSFSGTPDFYRPLPPTPSVSQGE